MYWHPLLQYYNLYANEIDIISRKFEVAEVIYSRTTHGGTLLKSDKEYRQLFMTHIILKFIRHSYYSYSCIRIFVNQYLEKHLLSEFILKYFHALF